MFYKLPLFLKLISMRWTLADLLASELVGKWLMVAFELAGTQRAKF